MLKNVGVRERASSMEKNQGKIKYWYAYPLLYVKNQTRINLDFLKGLNHEPWTLDTHGMQSLR